MNTESSAFSPVINPFATLMYPEFVIEAHERMATRAAGVVHRLLDNPRLVKAGQEAVAAEDAQIDADASDEADAALASRDDAPEISSGTPTSMSNPCSELRCRPRVCLANLPSLEA
jgi:hypothetical protein